MNVSLHVNLPQTEVSKGDFFQHLSQKGFRQQFHINWNGRVANNGELFAFSEATMPWRINPLRLLMKPQPAAAKLEAVRNLSTLIGREKGAIVQNPQYDVNRILDNLESMRDRMVRNTNAKDAGQIRYHFDAAIHTLDKAHQAHLLKSFENSPASWKTFFNNKRMTVPAKVAVAEKIASMIQQNTNLLRFMKVDTQKRIRTLTQIKRKVTKNIPNGHSKQRIEMAMNAAIKDLEGIGRLIKKDWNDTWRGWTWNHTLGPVTNRVLRPVVNLPVRVVKFPFEVINFVARKTAHLAWGVAKSPFTAVTAAPSRKK